jgi:hypothetical protein
VVVAGWRAPPRARLRLRLAPAPRLQDRRAERCWFHAR